MQTTDITHDTTASSALNKNGQPPLIVTVPEGFGVESGRKFKVYDRSLTPSEICDIGREARNKVQCLSMVAAAAAAYSLNETVCLLKEQGAYKFGVKKIGNETRQYLKKWYSEMKGLLGNRYEMMENMATDRISELNPMFEDARTRLALRLDRLGTERAKQASWLLMTESMVKESRRVFHKVRMDYIERIDFEDMFMHYNLHPRLGKRSENLCLALLPTQCIYDGLGDCQYLNAISRYGKELRNYDKLLPVIKELVCGEHSDMFSDEERKSAIIDCETAENQKE